MTKRKVSGGSRSMKRFAIARSPAEYCADLSSTGTVGHGAFQVSLNGQVRQWEAGSIALASTQHLNPYSNLTFRVLASTIELYGVKSGKS